MCAVEVVFGLGVALLAVTFVEGAVEAGLGAGVVDGDSLVVGAASVVGTTVGRAGSPRSESRPCTSPTKLPRRSAVRCVT